jgi:hypothetical protein
MKELKLNNGEPYKLQYEWPDCKLQGNGVGFVFGGKEKPRETAFFEAFPRNPHTFIRGEGETMEEAETAAWQKHQKTLACAGHKYKRHCDNGSGTCRHCGLFQSDVLPCLHRCHTCDMVGVGHYWSDRQHYCREHVGDKLDDALAEGVWPVTKDGWHDHNLMLQMVLQSRYYRTEFLKHETLPAALDDQHQKKHIDDLFRIDGHFFNNFAIVAVKAATDRGLSIVDLIKLKQASVLDETFYPYFLSVFWALKDEMRGNPGEHLYQDERIRTFLVATHLAIKEKQALQKDRA